MYNEIYKLCKIRNIGGSLKNGLVDYPERFKFIINLIELNCFTYDIIKYTDDNFPLTFFYNVYIYGDSDKMVIAHHDIYTPNSDNANDNSASIINCLMLKKLNPNLNIAIIDGEEPPCMGVGSSRLSYDIKNGCFGTIINVLNLELTGLGGESFFIGKLGSKLENHIVKLFNPIVTNVPFNDSIILMKNGIDSTVITTLPIKNFTGALNYSMMYNIHTQMDSVNTISVNDMKIFVEKIASKIVNII